MKHIITLLLLFNFFTLHGQQSSYLSGSIGMASTPLNIEEFAPVPEEINVEFFAGSQLGKWLFMDSGLFLKMVDQRIHSHFFIRTGIIGQLGKHFSLIVQPQISISGKHPTQFNTSGIIGFNADKDTQIQLGYQTGFNNVNKVFVSIQYRFHSNATK